MNCLSVLFQVSSSCSTQALKCSKKLNHKRNPLKSKRGNFAKVTLNLIQLWNCQLKQKSHRSRLWHDWIKCDSFLIKLNNRKVNLNDSRWEESWKFSSLFFFQSEKASAKAFFCKLPENHVAFQGKCTKTSKS